MSFLTNIDYKNALNAIISISRSLSLSLGGVGTVLITGAVTEQSYRRLQVQEDTTITVLTDQDDVDLMTALNITGNTLKAGSILNSTTGKAFKNITVTSGSLQGII